ncbi:MAG: hypothetical protein P4K86_07295 [Terracidiphilus sp.]|nr:hypothetical protein [Terracidiphilus sp.]MDR3776333.1 hypothetical protein [Terracidiphilus sp.]
MKKLQTEWWHRSACVHAEGLSDQVLNDEEWVFVAQYLALCREDAALGGRTIL